MTVQRQKLAEMSGGLPVVQRAPWQNDAVKFRTESGLQGITRSEYLVEATRYKRYAPVNEIRAPGQVFHEGPRSFAYLTANSNEQIAGDVVTVRMSRGTPNLVVLKDADGRQTTATRVAANGLTVWDGDVADNGRVGGRHTGHTVEDLGQPLPTLENAQGVERARKTQANVKLAQEFDLIKSDDFMKEKLWEISDRDFGGDDGLASAAMSQDPQYGGKIRAAGSGKLLEDHMKRIRARRKTI